MFVETAPVPAATTFANVSLTPAAEKSTVDASVASAIAAPRAAVAASLTVIVNVLVPVSLAVDVKLASCSAVPLMVADTVPALDPIIVFKVETPVDPESVSEIASVPLFDTVCPAKPAACVDVKVSTTEELTVKFP